MSSSLWQYLKLAGRSLHREPLLAITVILSLALGIGINSAVFSLLNMLLLRPLPPPQSPSLYRHRRGPTGFQGNVLLPGGGLLGASRHVPFGLYLPGSLRETQRPGSSPPGPSQARHGF